MKNKQIYLFLAAFTIFQIAANCAHPVTPTLIVERNLDSSMFGVALAAMLTMNFLFSPLWGKLCNYMPTKKILLFTSLGYSLGQIGFMLAQNEAFLLACRMFAGIFIGGVYTGFTNYIVNTASDTAERDRNLVLYATVYNVVAACGYFIGGVLGMLSTEAALLAQVIGLATGGVLFYLFCVDDTPFKHRPEAPLALRDVNPFGAFVTVRAYMTPMLALIFTIIAVSAIGQNAYEQCFNYYIKDQFGMSSAYNGTFKALIALLTLVLNSTVCITLQKKTDINRSFLYILFACTGLISLILIFRNQILFVGVYILYSAVNVLRLPLLQSMIANRSTPESSNNLMGFNQSMTSLGGIFGALFAGLIYNRGPMLPFILAFAAYAISALVGILYARQYNREIR